MVFSECHDAAADLSLKLQRYNKLPFFSKYDITHANYTQLIIKILKITSIFQT